MNLIKLCYNYIHFHTVPTQILFYKWLSKKRKKTCYTIQFGSTTHNALITMCTARDFHQFCSTITSIHGFSCFLWLMTLKSFSRQATTSSSSVHDEASTREGRLRPLRKHLPPCRSLSRSSPTEPLKGRCCLFTAVSTGWRVSRSSALILKTRRRVLSFSPEQWLWFHSTAATTKVNLMS